MSNEVFSFEVNSPMEEEIRYMTIVSESEGGAEQRYQKWQKPKRTFRLKLRARGLTEADQIWRFYTRHKGSFDSFLFQNPNENPVSAETVGSGDGSKTIFYLGGKVDVGTGDLIVTPSSAVLTKSVGGTGDYLTYSTYTINENTGQITTSPAVPSGDVLRASYNFRYRCRFKDDNLNREAFTSNLFDYGVDIIEVI